LFKKFLLPSYNWIVVSRMYAGGIHGTPALCRGFRLGPAPMSAKPQQAFSEHRQKLWRLEADYIREQGGWVTSIQNTSSVRFECPMESKLPTLLMAAGYDVRCAGTGERLLPMIIETVKQDGGITTITNQHVGPVEVGIFEFPIP